MKTLMAHIKARNAWLLAADILLLTALPVLAWNTLAQFDKMQWFGLVLLPFLLKTDPKRAASNRFLPFALLFGVLFLWLGQSYWAFACALSLLFFVIESNAGRLNNMAIYTLIFYLPLTRSFFMLFGFHIRLEITQWAAALLSLFDGSVTYGATQLTIAGEAFSVDAGCMGLRLVITGFLLTLLMIHQTAKARRYRPKTRFISSFLLLSFLLVIAANFFRIVLLIVYRSPEGSISHEVIGIATLIVFHTLPLLWLIQRFTPAGGSLKELEPAAVGNKSLWQYPMLILLAGTVMSGKVYGTGKAFRPGEDAFITAQLKGFERHEEMDGVCRFTNDRATVIVKPMSPLSFSNHHPLICWRGDGYVISNEAETEVGEVTCMSAQLRSEQHQMQTIWWYTDREGNYTTNEWEWRWNALFHGTRYYILNFTSTDHDQLVFTLTQQKDKLFQFAPKDKAPLQALNPN